MTTGLRPLAEAALWPTVAIMLLSVFLSTPLGSIRTAARDRRFMAGALTGNFVVIPALVWLLTQWAGLEGPALIGVVLVLVAPCTDWMIAFVRLAGGSVAHATAITPINVATQVVMLPLYLWWIADARIQTYVGSATVLGAVGIILVPLALAWVVQRRVPVNRLRNAEPVMVVSIAAVVMWVTLAHGSGAVAILGQWWVVVPLFVAFGVIALAFGNAVGRLAGQPAPQRRALAVSMASRNSFVVLPLALALPAGAGVAATIITVQAMVELLLLTGAVKVMRQVVRD